MRAGVRYYEFRLFQAYSAYTVGTWPHVHLFLGFKRCYQVLIIIIIVIPGPNSVDRKCPNSVDRKYVVSAQPDRHEGTVVFPVPS